MVLPALPIIDPAWLFSKSIFSAYIGGVAVLLTCAFTKLLPLAPDSTAELLDRGTSADELTALAGPPFRDIFWNIFITLRRTRVA